MIDLETTGLNHETCQIIEFGAVVDDLSVQAPLDKLPKFHKYIVHEVYSGEAYALAMHCEIFKKLAHWKTNGISVCSSADLILAFKTFLTTQAGYIPEKDVVKINVAGKNFANFDKNFLERLPYYNTVKIHHRILDPASLYFNPKKDSTLPSTETCMERAGIEGDVQHTAIEDALLVIKLLRNKFPKEH